MEEITKALVKHGRARAKARTKALEESRTLAELARQAVAAGMTKMEISKLAGLSRPALDAMLKGATDA